MNVVDFELRSLRFGIGGAGHRIAVVVVGVDDALHERMTNDIGAAKCVDVDAVDVAKDVADLEQAGLLGAGEIDLRYVAGDHHARVFAEAREKHHHLLGRGVLGFVENDERVRQRAAAHVGERGDFDDALFGEPADIVGIEHVVQRVVERTKIRKDFFAKIAGEEAEGFAGFDGGAGEDDAFDLVFEEGRDGGGHGEVGFTGAGGADAEDDGVFEDGLEVEFLADGFGDDRFAIGGDDERAREEFAELFALAAGDGVGDAVEIRGADRHALRAGVVEEIEERFGAGERFGGGLDLEGGIARDEFHAQGAFGVSEVFVAAGVERVEVARRREMEGFGGQAEELFSISDFRFSAGAGRLRKCGDDGGEAFPSGFEGLREGARLTDYGHEVGIAIPAWDDVGVEVRDAAAGGRAEIEADVEAIGFEGGGEKAFGEDDFRHEGGGFGGSEVFELGDFAERDGEQVAGIIGEAVEDQVGVLRAMDDESGAVVAESGQLAERALHPSRIPRRFDVFHAPVSVELLHFGKGRRKGVGGAKSKPGLGRRRRRDGARRHEGSGASGNFGLRRRGAAVFSAGFHHEYFVFSDAPARCDHWNGCGYAVRKQCAGDLGEFCGGAEWVGKDHAV